MKLKLVVLVVFLLVLSSFALSEKSFGIEQGDLPFFLEKKSQLLKDSCFGCQKTSEDISLGEGSVLYSGSNDISLPLGSLEKDFAMAKVLGDFSFNSSKMRRVIVSSADGSLSGVASGVNALGGTNEFVSKIGNVIVAKVPENMILNLASMGNVNFVFEDVPVKALLIDSKEQANVSDAYFSGFSGSGIRVAVVDTGIDSQHPMFAGRVVAEADFSGEGTANDLSGHGTHVAGIIAGSASAGGQFNGVAPEALLINAKALDSDGSGYLSSIIEAIAFSINPDGNPETNDGARVINLSFGAIGDFEDSPLEMVLQDAESLGVIIVTSSGNCGYENPDFSCGGYAGLTYPGSSSSVITVGSVDENNLFSEFSSRGHVLDYGVKPDFVAPGENVSSSWLNGGVKSATGTSASAAIASGAIALLLEKDPFMSPANVRFLLSTTSKDLGVKGRDGLYGFGLIDVNAALNEIDLIESNLVTFTPNPTNITIGLEDENFSKKIRLFNNTGKVQVVRDYIAPEWLNVSYPQEISIGNESYLQLYANQKQMGLGTHFGELVLAVGDQIIVHEITLDVVEGTTDYNSALGDFQIEFLLASTAVNATIDGKKVSKLGRGSTVKLSTTYYEYDHPGTYYGSLELDSGSYSCDTAPQAFDIISNGKMVNFYYTVPVNAPFGYYNVTNNPWEECSGQQYDGACYPSSSYSCSRQPEVISRTTSNIFEVVPGCTNGVCCDLGLNIPKSSSTVCEQQVASEFGCPNGNGTGADVFVRYSDKYCSGNSGSCDGAVEFDEWQVYEECSGLSACGLDESNNYACINTGVACYSDLDCADGWVGQLSCSALDANVLQDYKIGTCLDAGTTNSQCQYVAEPNRVKAECAKYGLICSDFDGVACIQKGRDECAPEDAGKSSCNVVTGNVELCYFNSAESAYKLNYESCGTGSCIEENDSYAYCDSTSSNFGIEVEKTPKGLPIYKRPGDKLKVNFFSKLENNSVNLEFDSNVFIASGTECEPGTKVLSLGDNYCDYVVSENAARKPFRFVLSKSNSWSTRIINVALPQTIFVTDSVALKQRFPNNDVRVDANMRNLYLKSFDVQGVVYDLSDYYGVLPQRPWVSWGEYNETLNNVTVAGVNEYVQGVSSFVKSRCPIEYCKHVTIVGDDFVVPLYRDVDVRYEGVFPAGFLSEKKEYTIFGDRLFVPTSSKSFSDSNVFFNKYEQVAIVIPSFVSSELREDIDYFKQVIQQKYGTSQNNIFEFNESKISCNSYLGHPLVGRTAVLIGTKETNQAIRCVRNYQETGENTFIVDRNPWGDIIKHNSDVLIVYSDDSRSVQLAANMLKYDLMRSQDYTFAEFFNDGLDTCSMLGYIPGIDVVGDVCEVGKSCGHFVRELAGLEEGSDNGIWCSVGGGISIVLPALSTKWAKVFAKHMDNVFFARSVGRFGGAWAEELFERFGRKFSKLGKDGAEEVAQLTIKATGKEIIDGKSKILVDKTGDYFSKLPSDKRDLIEAGGDNQLVKAFNAKQNSVTKDLFGNTINKIDNFAVLIKERLRHIKNRHWFGAEGLPSKTTSFLPGGQTIRVELPDGTIKIKELPNNMKENQIEGLVDETLKSNPVYDSSKDLLVYRKKVDKYGVRNMEVWVDSSTGRVETAFPVDGGSVWRWNKNLKDFELIG